MNNDFRLAIFASGSGTNAEEIFKYFSKHPSIHPALLLCNKPEANVLTRAKNFNIDSIVFNKTEFTNGTVLEILKSKQITHVILAGFLWLMPESIISAFAGRIINIHPALLPAFGGKGMYGMKVHQAVKDANHEETGITIHEVNKNYDEGRVVFQAKCKVLPDDSPENIAEKVHKLEYEFFPAVIESWITGIPLKTAH